MAKAKKSLEVVRNSKTEEEAEKIAGSYVTIVGEFKTKVYEEETTTKIYKFPKNNLFIIASVFYTDELMASTNTTNSMLLGITISKHRLKDAFDSYNVAEAEVTHDKNTDVVRVKKYVFIQGRRYLVGLQCDCKALKEKEPGNN